MSAGAPRIQISVGDQRLSWFGPRGDTRTWLVSTGANGTGQGNGTGATPLGRHVVRARIGAEQPINAVFVGRRPTGEVFSPALARQFPRRDWILSRILWLSGCDVGFNRLGDVDTMRRFIYIHGCPDTCPMGVPMSHGCVRMRNADVCELFDLAPVGTPVEISP